MIPLLLNFKTFPAHKGRSLSAESVQPVEGTMRIYALMHRHAWLSCCFLARYTLLFSLSPENAMHTVHAANHFEGTDGNFERGSAPQGRALEV